MLYRIKHRTTYTYSAEVAVGDHVACLQPRSLSAQEVLFTELVVEPSPAVLTSKTDYFGNVQHLFTVQDPHKTLVVESRSEVRVSGGEASRREHRVFAPHAREGAPVESRAWEDSASGLMSSSELADLQACQFQFGSPRIRLAQDLGAYARLSFTPRRPFEEALLDFNNRMHRDFHFDAKVTNVRTRVEEVFTKRRGVCQDFAHVAIACLRSIGLAARYVSGYLRTYPPPGRPRLVGADASHAWLAVYGRGRGWLDIDPTNNVVPTDGHVTVGWGRDYSDVSPLRGLILGGGGHEIKVEVDMEPVETAEERVAQPN